MRRAIEVAWTAAPVALAIALLGTAAAAAAPVAVAWVTKLVLEGVAGGRHDDIQTLAVMLAAAGALALAIPQLLQHVQARMRRASAALAQDRLFGAVLRLPGLGPFEDPAVLDRLRMARQAAGGAPDGVVTGLLGAARSVLMAGAFLGSLAALSSPMTAAIAAAAVPALWAHIALARHRANSMMGLASTVRREFFYGDLLVDAQAAQEIRLFGTGRFLRDRVRGLRQESDAAYQRMDRSELLVQGGLTLLTAAITGAGLVWAIGAAVAGRLTVGDISMFAAAVAGVQTGLGGAVRDVGEIRHQLLVFRHYLDFVDAPAGVGETPPLPPLRHGIELRDVWFRYSPEHPWILRGVDLFLPAGAAVALVGHNGAGKSTLVKLLCKLYEPTRGAILWDGTDLRDVPGEALWPRLSAVFQDFMRYELSARENVALGDLSSLDDVGRVRQAAERAGVHAALAGLPRGYDTLLTRGFFDDPTIQDTGVVLSGGQWQRLALARAMLRDRRDLMILDEPSAGLDAAAEHEIHVSLREHRRGRTSLLISHRLGALRDADHIAVLDGGTIAERGTHDELIAAGGRYAELFRLQAGPYQEVAAA